MVSKKTSLILDDSIHSKAKKLCIDLKINISDYYNNLAKRDLKARGII